MNADLQKLLTLQDKDRHLSALLERRQASLDAIAALDAVVAQAKADIAAAARAAGEVADRRDEAERKLEAQRVQHERRRVRLEQERNPRVAAQLLADVELGRSILTQEESEWLRLSEDAGARASQVGAAEAQLGELIASQEEARAQAGAQLAEVDAEIEGARAEREAAASQLERTLRVRYDRLRGSRRTEILVPASNATCTACYTMIPRSRIGTLQSAGILIEGCEMCGAILYLPPTEESA